MAVYTNTENDIVLSDVHVSLSHSENINQGQNSQIKETWLSRFYFRLPQTCKTTSQPLEVSKTGSLSCRFGQCSSTATSHTKRTCDSLEKLPLQFDEDGDSLLLRRVSQKLIQSDSKSSFQHQMTFTVPQKIDPDPAVMSAASETTTCLLKQELPGLYINGSRTIVGGWTDDLVLNVLEDNDEINLPHGIATNTEDLSVHDSVHGSVEKNPEFDDGDVNIERRRAEISFHNAFKVENDNKKVFSLFQASDSSIHKLSTERKYVYPTSMYDPLRDCSVVSVQGTQNKLLKSHSTICNNDTSKGANMLHCKNLKQPGTSEQRLTSSTFHEFDTCREDNKCCSLEVKSEMVAHPLSLKGGQFTQDHSVLLNDEKLKPVQNESLNGMHIHSGHFSLSEIKTLNQCLDEELIEEQVTSGVLTLEHSMGTSIPEVGYQVWSGALLLCDYLLHNCTDLDKAVVLDLGTGTGIVAVVAAMFAPQVLSTDYLSGVVALAERNWERNKDLLPFRACDEISFKILDWTRDWRSLDSVPASKYSLTSSDLKLVEEATLILAAEAIYDDDLTDGLFTTIYNLLLKPPSKTVVLTVERRVIFSVENKDVCSPAYEHFLTNLEDLVTVDEGPVSFTVKKCDSYLPQFFPYQRVKELELWEISSQVSS